MLEKVKNKIKKMIKACEVAICDTSDYVEKHPFIAGYSFGCVLIWIYIISMSLITGCKWDLVDRK